MALPTASDNPFPSLLITEAVDPAAPAAGKKRLFIDTDHHLKTIDSSSAVVDYTPGAGGSVATDAIWDAAGDLAVGTGADTAAKLAKGNAGGVVAMGNGAVIWNAGTSFPGSKATGDRYWRTDLGMEFYWDGTRWLSTELFVVPFNHAAVVAGSTSPIERAATWGSTHDMYLVDWLMSWYIITTNNGSNYWTLDLVEGDTGTSIVSFSTAALGAAGTWRSTKTAVNALFTSGKTTIQVNGSMTGATGGLVLSSFVTYRLIGV